MAWRDFAEKNPDLPVGFVIQGATTTELPDEVVAGYDAPFPNGRVQGGRGPVPAARPDRGGCPGRRRDARGRRRPRPLGEAGAGGLLRQRPRLSRIRDRASDSSSWIPTVSEQVKIEGAAHFLQEDRGEQIAGEILRFLGLKSEDVSAPRWRGCPGVGGRTIARAWRCRPAPMPLLNGRRLPQALALGRGLRRQPDGVRRRRPGRARRR